MTCPTTTIIYDGNDNILELRELKNVITDAYANAATVTVTLVDSAAAEVVGESWPLTMDYVSASDGYYRATLVDTLTLTVDAVYTAQITATSDGVTAYWEAALTCETRTG